jgi:hypothetical protein
MYVPLARHACNLVRENFAAVTVVGHTHRGMSSKRGGATAAVVRQGKSRRVGGAGPRGSAATVHIAPDASKGGQVDLGLPRCFGGKSAEYARYHDEEWGVPVHDDMVHFEVLTLEGAQAGLSFETVLKKRNGYLARMHVL